MNIKGWFKQRIWEIGGFFLVIFILWINLFPGGHIILGADILQPINMAVHYQEFHYEWLGKTSLFYSIFFLLDSFGVSSTAQISWYLGIFLFGSYFSFLGFCRLTFPFVSRQLSVLIALFYTTNIYTLFVFTTTWGYTHYQSIYIFIPILTGLYIKFLEERGWKHLLYFCLGAFGVSAGFGNPAFALSLGIYFFLLTVFLFLFRFVRFEWLTLKKISVAFFAAVLLNSYWMLPLLPQMSSGVQSVYTSEFIDLTEALRKTSSAIFDTVRFLPTSEQSRYYPSNFPYPSISWLEEPILFLAFTPFFLLLIGFLLRKEEREGKIYGIFLALLVMFIALVARVRYPFDVINSFLFQLPGFNTLRGWDKLATFMPFLASVPLLIFFISIQGYRYYRFVLGFFFIVMILLALPFYAGGIQTKMSYILSSQKAKDFSLAKQSALVKIPDSYYSIIPLLGSDREENKISMLPYSPGSSVGRVGLPSWKVNGPHPAHGLYEQEYVELTDYYLPGWLFAKEFENTGSDSEWIIDLYGLIGVKYILYHKDAKQSAMDAMEATRRQWENSGKIHLVQDTPSFFLYRVDERYLFPYLYSSSVAPPITFTPQGILEATPGLHDKMKTLEYERENPLEVKLSTRGIAPGETIFLNEKYDPLWRAQYVSAQGERTMLQRNEDVKYANAWRITEPFPEGELVVYYGPVRLLSIGEWVSGITLLSVLLGLGWKWKKRHNL